MLSLRSDDFWLVVCKSRQQCIAPIKMKLSISSRSWYPVAWPCIQLFDFMSANPIHHSIERATLFVDVEVRLHQRSTIDPLVSDQAGVCGTHDVLTQYIDAMVSNQYQYTSCHFVNIEAHRYVPEGSSFHLAGTKEAQGSCCGSSLRTCTFVSCSSNDQISGSVGMRMSPSTYQAMELMCHIRRNNNTLAVRRCQVLRDLDKIAQGLSQHPSVLERYSHESF